MKKLNPATRSQIEELLRNGDTVASISRATGVHINTIYQIRNLMYTNEIPADAPIPCSLTSLADALKVTILCEELGFDHAYVRELLADKAVKIDEIKKFQAWSQTNLEICTKATLRARDRYEAELEKKDRLLKETVEKLIDKHKKETSKHEKEKKDLAISVDLLKKAIASLSKED